MAQINKPNTYFNTVLYTGTGAILPITGVGFKPDFTWIKVRNNSTYSHVLYDVIRGFSKSLSTNGTGVENDETAEGSLISFDSDGFTLDDFYFSSNRSGDTYASWSWKAGGTAVSNTDGSITSSVSANTTSGFSIVSYTGTGANATVGHGLGVAPSMIIFKERSGTSSWITWHKGLTSYNYYLLLNTTDAQSNAFPNLQNVAPTSSVFSVGTGQGTNGSSATYIAYCFAEKKGFSKFGSYTGNGSADGAFVYTGFKPAFVLIKKSSASGDNWHIWDSVRDTYNVVNKRLVPNSSVQEYNDFNVLDFCSNGFKLRDGSTYWNASGATFIYMAFAENPLVGTNNIPATAR